MSAQASLSMGDSFPYDAPDAWWDDGGATPPPSQDWAQRAARGVVADLKDRGGIKQGFDDVDEETRLEIITSLAEIIRTAAKEGV